MFDFLLSVSLSYILSFVNPVFLKKFSYANFNYNFSILMPLNAPMTTNRWLKSDQEQISFIDQVEKESTKVGITEK